jgi:hypothetical protein
VWTPGALASAAAALPRRRRIDRLTPREVTPRGRVVVVHNHAHLLAFHLLNSSSSCTTPDRSTPAS